MTTTKAHAHTLNRAAQIGAQLEELATEIQCTGTSDKLFNLYTRTRDLHTELWHAYLDLKAQELEHEEL
jgi:hypothetical protein